jgi:glycosyltransferase involved in cell wall biosynthesis
MKIAILMATYNGEKYLREQIDSLLAQTCQDWHLYMHDDGSKDNTLSILREYTERYADRMTLMDYPSQGGACKNFMSMLERVEAPYYMFCDQDDIWLPEKITASLEVMRQAMLNEGNNPVIVNTDLIVVDEAMRIIHPSLWQYENIHHEFPKCFSDYAALNVVTGCTMLFNNRVKDIIRKPYDKAVMHDTWITLCTIASGGILCNVEKPTILYRQHGSNTLGACDASMLTVKYKVRNIKKVIYRNMAHYRQMRAISPISWCEYAMTKIRYLIFIMRHK